VKLSKAALFLLTLCCVGTLAVFSVLRLGSFDSSQECIPRISDAHIRGIVVSEMLKRQVVPQRISVSQLNDERFGRFEIETNPDWSANSKDEYSSSKYLALFSEADFRFWALISSCGLVNMAGIGNFSR
jgi:hypothetical protein